MRFREKNADLTHMQRFVGRISALLNPLTYVIVNLAIVAILRTGAVRVDVRRAHAGAGHRAL